MVRGSHRRTLVLVLGTLAGLCASGGPASAIGLSCDQPGGPTANTLLVCSGDPCVVSQNFEAPAGCALDFESRTVVFRGTFDVADQTLTVDAGAITVEGQLLARSDGTDSGGLIQLTAGHGGGVVISGTIDVSGNPGGEVQASAEGAATITSSGRLRANGRDVDNPNAADAGSIDVLAGAAVVHQGTIEATGGSDGTGGEVRLQAGGDLVVAQSIDTTGGEGGGGLIDLTAGDDVTIERKLDASAVIGGGCGGAISVLAGLDALGGDTPGGRLDVRANLVSDGSSAEGFGCDGGDLSLGAFGPVVVDAAATLRAVGASPDGFGGTVVVDSADAAAARVTALDGDIELRGPIVLRGAGALGDGGDLEAASGRSLTVTGAVDVSGGSRGGTVTAASGVDLRIEAPIAGEARIAGGGGSIELTAGSSALGTLTIAHNVDVRATGGGTSGSVVLAGCHLVVEPTIRLDMSGGSGATTLDLVATQSLTLRSASQYLAGAAGQVALRHPPALVPTVAPDAVFVPGRTTDTVGTDQYPPCPVCGDGIRQTGEPCDNGPGADGACCNADCSALACATPTPTATGPTRTPTPTASRTPTPTSTLPPPTATPIPSPTAPPIEPRALLGCAQAFGRASTKLALAELGALDRCSGLALKCLQTRPAGDERAACLAATADRCDRKLGELTKARARFGKLVDTACGGTPPRVPFAHLRLSEGLGFEVLEPQCLEEIGLALTSLGAVAACVRLGGPCAVDDALGVAIPRIGDLADLLFDAGAAGFCLPDPLGAIDGLAGTPDGRAVLRCQKGLATAARRQLKRQLGVAFRCVESLTRCRLQGGDPAACAKPAARCARKLDALHEPGRGLQAKLTTKILRACGGLDPATVRDLAGVGFSGADARCAALGEAAPTTPATIADCVGRALGCAASAVVRHAMPLADTELARVGLALGDDVFCTD